MLPGDPSGMPGGTGGPPLSPPGGVTAPLASYDAAQEYTNANNAYQKALVRFNQQRTGLLQQYGYKGDIDPTTGMVKNVSVDAGNMHGGLQSLLHNQALEDQNAEYAAEDRGLHGGLAHQAEGELHYQHGGQTSALARQLQDNLGGIDASQLDAKNTLDQALWQSQHDAAQQAALDQLNKQQSDLMNQIYALAYAPQDDGSDYGDDGGDGGGGGNPLAGQVAATVARQVANSPVAKASMAALTKAKKSGASASAAALAARSAGLNAKYGLSPAPKKAAAPKKQPANAYTSGAKKRG